MIKQNHSLKLVRGHTVSIERIYTYVYFILSVNSIVDASLISTGYFSDVILAICGAILAGIIVYRSLKKKIPLWRFVLQVLIIFFFVISSYVTRRSNLLIFALLIMGAESSRFHQIVRYCMRGLIAGLLIVGLALAFGIIHDYMQGRAHCFGFSYYHHVPYAMFNILLMYLYLRKTKLKLVSYIVIVVINWIVFHYTRTELVFLLTFVVLIFRIIVDTEIRIDRPLIIHLSWLVFPLLCVLTYIAMRWYQPSAIWAAINRFSNKRLYMMNLGYTRYGITLLGQFVEMIGGNVLRTQKVATFYIDSAYAYSLLAYGLIFTMLVIFMYSKICSSAAKNNDKMLFFWCVAIALFSLSNNIWINLYNVPLLTALMSKKPFQGKLA